MDRTNSIRQARWRNKLKARAAILEGTPIEIANNILGTLGLEQAWKVSEALATKTKDKAPGRLKRRSRKKSNNHVDTSY
jgi:hypothetical protein